MAPQLKMKRAEYTQHAAYRLSTMCRCCVLRLTLSASDDIFLFFFFVPQIHKVLKMSQQYSNISLIKHIKKENIHHTVRTQQPPTERNWEKAMWIVKKDARLVNTIHSAKAEEQKVHANFSSAATSFQRRHE